MKEVSFMGFWTNKISTSYSMFIVHYLVFNIYVKNVDKFKSQRDHISLSTIRNVHKMTKDKKDDWRHLSFCHFTVKSKMSRFEIVFFMSLALAASGFEIETSARVRSRCPKFWSDATHVGMGKWKIIKKS